jgi:hypothetical protein
MDMDFFDAPYSHLDMDLDTRQQQDRRANDRAGSEPLWDEPGLAPNELIPGMSETIIEKHETLNEKYANMVHDKEETVIFDSSASLSVQLHEEEICRVLGLSFPFLFYAEGSDMRTSRELLQEVEERSNFTVHEIVCVMNKNQYRMHRALAETYGIDTSRTTFHGTAPATAALITSTGFKGAACQRALYGKGVYSSPDIWEALGYATPTSEAHQIVFVVDYLQGPHAKGVKDQIDFGVDCNGNEILTLTNPEESILCASKENQLLATYRMTVRYLSDRPFTHSHRDLVRVVHTGIGRIIRDKNNVVQTAPPPATTLAPASPAAPVLAPVVGYTRKSEIDAHHHTFQIGDRVRVKSALKAYTEFTNATGEIKRIVQGHIYFFCVLLDLPWQRQSVQHINSLQVNKVRFPFLKPDESEFLCLKVGMIDRHRHSAAGAAQDESVLGKRKADADGT